MPTRENLRPSDGPASDPSTAPRVLIVSTDLGGGHDALAAGLRSELVALHPEAVVEIDNGLRSTSNELSELAREGYKRTVEQQPWIFQLWYWLLSASAFARIARWLAWRGMSRSVLQRVAQLKPDVVVSTYPFLTAVLGKLRREGQLSVPAVGLLIDSGPHDVWLAPGIDLHVAMNPVDCERARAVWPSQRYYPPLHITTARPAVDDRCRRGHDRAAGREQFGLPDEGPVLLVSGGSWGLAVPDADLVALIEQTDVHVAIACGNNAEMRDQLSARLPSARATVIGFTREMPTLLTACDAALLNAGGMTCHECFALGTPVLLYQPIAGHGRSAARALDEDGLATWVRDRDQLVEVAGRIGAGDPDLAARAGRARTLQDRPRLAEVVLSATMQPIPAGEALSTSVFRHLSGRLNLFIGLAVAVGLGSTLYTQRDAVSSFRWDLSALDLATGLVLMLVGPLTQAVAFWLLLRLTGAAKATLPEALAVWSWSALARYTPGGVLLFAVRVKEGARLGATRLQVLAASLYEQVLAVAGAATLSAFAFVVALGQPPPLLVAGALAALVGVIAARPSLLGGRIARVARLHERGLQPPRGRGMALVMLLNAAGWVAVGSGASIAVDGLAAGPSVDGSFIIAIYTLAWLAGFVSPFAPGGIGVREAVIVSFLAPSHGVGVASAIAIGLRMLHTVADVLASALIEVGYRSRRVAVSETFRRFRDRRSA